MRKKVITVIIIIAAIILIAIYNVKLNNSIKILEENIKVKDLPKEFENFKILQLSDLHNKVFGENQQDLIDVINSLDYDIIAITGDMTDEKHTDDITSFIQLLDGIKNREYIFYVKGNNGLTAVDEKGGDISNLSRSSFGRTLNDQ